MPQRSAVAIQLGLDKPVDAHVDQLSVAVTLASVQLGPYVIARCRVRGIDRSEQSGHVKVTVLVEPFESQDAQSLIRALDEYLTGLYPPENNFLDVAEEELRGERGAFLVARIDGVAVGCGAIRRLSSSAAEIKRMFVLPEARGRGVGSVLLTELMSWAAAVGVSKVVLETGKRQGEAVRLYERFGFVPIPCFGEYAGSAQSLCYERAVDPSST